MAFYKMSGVSSTTNIPAAWSLYCGGKLGGRRVGGIRDREKKEIGET